MSALIVPQAYRAGYALAEKKNRELARRYVTHTMVGDPELDPVLEELADLPSQKFHQYLYTCIEQVEKDMHQVPQVLRDFFDDLENSSPQWLDHKAFRPGVRAFYANADLVLVAFVTGVLVEGFSTLISKSFNMTDRVKKTERRLMQNNRQLLEIFYPHGLERSNEGWKLSFRVRVVHARVRQLLNVYDEWDLDSWGIPISAAHLGYAICTFSQSLLTYSQKVGANFSESEQQSIMDIWRYTGYVMGIPETILYTSREEAKEIKEIGFLCEPSPTVDSVEMANNLIQSIPKVARIDDPREQKKTVDLAYRLSRALIGNKLANDFKYPRSSKFLTLKAFRWKQYRQKLSRGSEGVRFENFDKLVSMSVYEKMGVDYRLQDAVQYDKSSEW